MKKTKQLLVLLIILTIVACENNDSLVTSNESDLSNTLQTLMDDEYESYIAKYPDYPGGMALHVTSLLGDVFVNRGFPEPITSRYHFRPQSVTKSFTAAGIMLLNQRGLLDIHHYITDNIPGTNIPYVPDTPDYNIPYKNEIRIWDLLTHRAGVFDPVNEYSVNYRDSLVNIDPNHTFTLDEIIGVVARYQTSYFPPREGWHYSNAGYVILAKIIERISGKSYKQFMNDEFVVPLGLTDTSFPDQGSEQTLPSPYVDSWYWSQALTINATEYNMTFDIGEGNMICSTEDLNKFFKLLFNGNAGINITKVRNYMMDCRPVSDIGSLAWGGGVDYMMGLGYGHGGDGNGITTKCVYDPDNDLMITFFYNCWNFKDGPENQTYFWEQQSRMNDFLYRVKDAATGF